HQRACALHEDPGGFVRCARCPKEGCRVAIRTREAPRSAPPRLQLDDFQTLQRIANDDIPFPFSTKAFGHTERMPQRPRTDENPSDETATTEDNPVRSRSSARADRTRQIAVLIVELLLFAGVLWILFLGLPGR